MYKLSFCQLFIVCVCETRAIRKKIFSGRCIQDKVLIDATA